MPDLFDQTTPYAMRAPCKKCGCTNGRIETRSGQDCVLCQICGAFQYNAPKTETGRAPRTVSTTHDACGPKIRARILLRANGACELCHAASVPLHVGHLVSVEAGHRAGMTDSEINSHENLCCLCDQCNLGLGSDVVPVRLAVAMVLARLRNQGRMPE